MNYDQWKLSNPYDDGYGYDMVSNCCGAQYDDLEERCTKCKEHCEGIEDYEYEARIRESIAEDRMDEERLGL